MHSLLKSIGHKEWQFVAWVSLAIMLITAVPYLSGYVFTPRDMVYNGLHTLTPGDIPVYYSYIEQIKEGGVLLNDLMTTEQGMPTLNVVWLGVGAVARLFSLSAPVAFHVVRTAAIPFLVVVLYLWCAKVFASPRARRAALCIAIFASGVGAYTAPFLPQATYAAGKYQWPMDLWVPEAFSFLTMLHSPHLIVSTALLVLSFLLLVTAVEVERRDSIIYHALGAGIAALILFQFHPFYIPTLFGIWGVFVLAKTFIARKIPWNIFGITAIFTLISAPSILYHLWLFAFDPLTVGRATQNLLFTPSFVVTLMSYGALLFLAAYGTWAVLRARAWNENTRLFLILWAWGGFILLYAPLFFQRRLTEGLIVPLALLAMIGLTELRHTLNMRMSAGVKNLLLENPVLFALLFVLILAPSTLAVFVNDIVIITNPKYLKYFYLPKEAVAAYRWLKSSTPQDAGVLADDYFNGKFLAAFGLRRVYAAHGVETLRYEAKQAEVSWFFAQNHSEEKEFAFLNAHGISYVFFGPWERARGVYKPENKSYLQQVFRDGLYTVYAVGESERKKPTSTY